MKLRITPTVGKMCSGMARRLNCSLPTEPRLPMEMWHVIRNLFADITDRPTWLWVPLRYGNVTVPKNSCKSRMYRACRLFSLDVGCLCGCRYVSWHGKESRALFKVTPPILNRITYGQSFISLYHKHIKCYHAHADSAYAPIKQVVKSLS
jgi:hypothetical protein